MTTFDENKRVLTPADVAKYLHVSQNLIYRQLKANSIPHLRLGDKYLIARSTLEKLMAGKITLE